MPFAILRTAKIKTAGNAGGLSAHLERKMEVPNADPDLTHLNRRLAGTGDLAKDISDRLEKAGITPRKNAVLAVEYLMTFSPEMTQSMQKKEKEGGGYTLTANAEETNKWKEFHLNCQKWISKRHGMENIVNFTVHMDEKTPHIHAVVVPIDAKGKLNCREFLGGREKLQTMQDSFAKVHEGIGLERGVAGSKAMHQELKKFYTSLPELNTSPSELSKQAEQGKVYQKENKALTNELNYTQQLVQSLLDGKFTVEQLKEQIKNSQEKAAQELAQKNQIKKPNRGMSM